MGLQELATNVWCAEGDMYMGGKIHFPVRMLVVRLSDGKLLLHSPIKMDNAVEEAIKALGEVGYIIAPNLLHHLFAKKAMARFPGAQLYGAPGFAKKRPDLEFAGFLGESGPYPWSDDLAQVTLEGAPMLNETVFFHEATGSLIVTDLVFNMRKRHNFQTDLMHRMVGVYRKLAQSRLIRMVTKDKAALRQGVELMMAWHPTRLIMAHGDIYEGDVNAALTKAMAWLGPLSPAAKKAAA